MSALNNTTRTRHWSVQCSRSGLPFLPTATSWYPKTVTSHWGWPGATSTFYSGPPRGSTLWSTWMFVQRYHTSLLAWVCGLKPCVDVYIVYMETFSFPLSLFCDVKEGQVIRISFSNKFKEFKMTPTWLQFPFLCGAGKDSVYESTAKSARCGKKTWTHMKSYLFTHRTYVGIYVCVYIVLLF